MALLFGQTLADALLVTGSLQSLLASGHFYFFAGPLPTAADAALSGQTALLTVDNGGVGVTWQNTAVGGVMSKTTAENWAGTIGTTGQAAYFRYCVGTDNGQAAAVAGNYRIQGIVGTTITADLLVSTVNFVQGNVITLSNGQLALPIS